jgi:hypothetical protein
LIFWPFPIYEEGCGVRCDNKLPGYSGISRRTARCLTVTAPSSAITISQSELMKDQQMRGAITGLSQLRAPLSPNRMCEKLWTLPVAGGAPRESQ